MVTGFICLTGTVKRKKTMAVPRVLKPPYRSLSGADPDRQLLPFIAAARAVTQGAEYPRARSQR
jgi:hypothetical protein